MQSVSEDIQKKGFGRYDENVHSEHTVVHRGKTKFARKRVSISVEKGNSCADSIKCRQKQHESSDAYPVEKGKAEQYNVK
jgi:hypothetical protein